MADLVAVARVLERSEAICMRHALEASGIHASLPELNYLDNNPFLVFALGGYRVLVVDSDEADARAVLADCARDVATAPIDLERRSGPINLALALLVLGVTVVFVPIVLRPRAYWRLSGS